MGKFPLSRFGASGKPAFPFGTFKDNNRRINEEERNRKERGSPYPHYGHIAIGTDRRDHAVPRVQQLQQSDMLGAVLWTPRTPQRVKRRSGTAARDERA